MRTRRMTTGKLLVITDRDIALFRALTRYRYLRSTYLHAFAGGASETRFKERLGDLFHEGYLDRPQEQWRFANSRYRPVVHELGARARQILSEHGIADGEERTWFRDVPHRQFEHSLMVCEILASIELGMRERLETRLVPWTEILAKAPEQTRRRGNPFLMTVQVPGLPEAISVAPDAVFGIEYQSTDRKLYRFFALEADRGTMPIVRSHGRQTSYLGKIAAYREVLARQVHKAQLGLPNLLVLTVTTSALRKSEIIRRIEGQSDVSAGFLFKAVDDTVAPAPQLFCEPWARAGHHALCIVGPY
ncbi:MAG: replication-relaxation family protein [Patescibacteria group bacterium]|nr:replication-relaxation family protein [Patescibacteria group bacterium]